MNAFALTIVRNSLVEQTGDSRLSIVTEDMASGSYMSVEDALIVRRGVTSCPRFLRLSTKAREESEGY
jgi:hypothetical protein